jgi:3-hydroxybutyryl-CoA dehydrogenase
VNASIGSAVPSTAAVGVVGAGAMGSGIAQVAAAAGHPVRIFDTQPGAADRAAAAIAVAFEQQVAKGRLEAGVAARAAARVRSVGAVADLAGCALVVEAIVEDLAVKRALFSDLEAWVGDEAILATNTSSISITAIAAGRSRPGRIAGLHFFNPPPSMALVEVVSGLDTDPAVAATLRATAAAWGKRPVDVRSTPGFIVNRVARPFYGEALRLLAEGAADPATLDAVLRDGGGFRMGPFELMDLIGHDVNYAVTRSVFDAFHGDPRFAPSVLQLELVRSGRLGRKSGRGFFAYGADAQAPVVRDANGVPPAGAVRLNAGSSLARVLAQRLRAAGVASQAEDFGTEGPLAITDTGAWVFEADGRTASQLSRHTRRQDVVVLDLLLDPGGAKRIAAARSGRCSDAGAAAAFGVLQAAGFAVSELKDLPALAVLRTVVMLASEAADAVHHGVADGRGVDLAMRHGANHPIGPLAWADRLGAATVVAVLDRLSAYYGDARYRASALLRWAADSDRCLVEP